MVSNPSSACALELVLCLISLVDISYRYVDVNKIRAACDCASLFLLAKQAQSQPACYHQKCTRYVISHRVVSGDNRKVFGESAMRNSMNDIAKSRREFLKATGLTTASFLLSPRHTFANAAMPTPQNQSTSPRAESTTADYTLHIKSSPIEIAPKRIISLTTYNGQFPGPLLRFHEGQQATIDIFNDTDTPEQLHWHGQKVSSDVDGAAEEGTPYIPAHGKRRIVFTPQPSGFRFYHTHNRAGADLAAGQYSGQVGPLYIQPKHDPGGYDREVFLTLKEFEPTFSRGGDMAQNFLSPSTRVKLLEDQGESAMKASLAKGLPHGYEVGYASFTINGRMLGHGDPIRVKRRERILFHILNGSATEIRSLALPGHSFEVVALDGNPVPNPHRVPVLWLGTAERISAIVQMNHPGVWIMGDLDNDDRRHGMGIVVEYAGSSGKPQWLAPPPFRWDYTRFTNPAGPVTSATNAASTANAPPLPDETFDMLFEKDNAAEEGFNRWTINGLAYPHASSAANSSANNMPGEMAPPQFHLTQGKRYRIRMRNASDDIHPIHLHRHSFDLTSYAGKPTSGILKDVLMLGGYQQAEIQFLADNPGITLFHCHQQLHMDFGFMTLFDYL
jgi:FtsP/CotA-like multicopper oxidase with cupredoxin domain